MMFVPQIAKGYILKSTILFLLLVLSNKFIIAQDYTFITTPTDSLEIKKRLNYLESLNRKTFNSDLEKELNQLHKNSKTLQYKNGEHRSNLLLGSLYATNGQTEKSIANFKSALLSAGTINEEIKSLNGLIACYSQMGNFEATIKVCLEAINKLENSSDTLKNNQLLSFYYKIAVALDNAQQYEKALYYINMALDNRELLVPNSELLPKLWGMKGMELHYTNKNTDSALLFIDSAIAYSERFNYINTLHPTLSNKGVLLNRSGRSKEAIPVLERAVALSMTNNIIKNEHIGSVIELGLAHLNTNNYKTAEKYMLEAWIKVEQLPRQKLYLSFQLGKLYEQKHDLKNALKYKNIYITLRDSIYKYTLAENTQRMEAEFRTLEKDKELLGNKLLIVQQKSELAEKNFWILGLSSASILVLGGISCFFYFRTRKRKSQEAIARLKSIIEGEEMERGRIAQELHDGVASHLNAIKRKLEHHSSNEDIKDMVNQTSYELRNIAYNLTEQELMSVGLSNSIRFFISRTFENTDFEIDLQLYDSVDIVSPDLSLSIYRIVQELIQNIIKHSNASHITMMLYKNEQTLLLLTEDNGKPGFVANQKKGIGTQSIAKRIKAHNGRMKTGQNVNGYGWVTEIEFPL